MKIHKFNERINWKGEWIPEDGDHPLDKVREYTTKQDLVKELLTVTKKYQGKIKDKTIFDALTEASKKYDQKLK